MFRMVFCSVILALVQLASTGAVDAWHPKSQGDSSELATRILTLTDVVLAQHIDPPARQQMVLDATKALYQAADQRVPKDLSERVSEMGTRDQLSAFLETIEDQFADVDNAESILTQGLLSAVPGGSYVLEAKQSQVNEQVINNRYVGTGISLKMNEDEGLTQIIRVFHNGPAWKAGIKPLDLIREIDGESTHGMSLAQVVEALRGEAGSEVETVVRQPDTDKDRRLTMTRNRVFIPSVEGVKERPDGQWDYIVDSDNSIALLRFQSIGPSTLHELRQISRKLRQQGAKGVILDLRRGGGILHDIVMVADSLIDEGAIGEIRSLDRTVEHVAQPGDLFDGLPMVVLVEKSTSAGNVFLTAALQDNGRAIVVGEPTVGETYVNSFVQVPGRDDQLRLATAVMHRGDGTPLLRSRIVPNPMTELVPGDSASRPNHIVPDHLVRPPMMQAGYQAQPNDLLLQKAVQVLSTGAAQASKMTSEYQGG